MVEIAQQIKGGLVALVQIIYNALVSACSTAQDPQAAERWRDQMLKDGFSGDEISERLLEKAKAGQRGRTRTQTFRALD